MRVGKGLANWRKEFKTVNCSKTIGVYTKIEMAEQLYKKHGSAEARAELERDAADYAGADHGWMVALWIPEPKMRFKEAEVLVDAGSEGSRAEIITLGAWDHDNGGRGSEIVESHRSLWAMRAYADNRLTEEQREVSLRSLEGSAPDWWVGQGGSATCPPCGRTGLRKRRVAIQSCGRSGEDGGEVASGATM